MSGRLYIVYTPIGNLGDITARALETLRTADVIAAEDTRRTAALLSAYDIHGSLISFHEHSSRAKAEELLRRLLSGESIAIVTDAGTPIISDPGEVLTKLAADNGIEIVSVPGACAAISALTVSAIDASRFTFQGFLPRDKTRSERISEVVRSELTSVLYESPHHLSRTLSELAQLIPNRSISVCKELTKLHESVWRGNISDAAAHFSEGAQGEYVLVIAGAESADADELTDEAILNLLRNCIKRGMSRKDAVKDVTARTGEPRNRIYSLSSKL